MTQTYNTGATKILTGLEPVRRRPGMYTDTTRPSHLGQKITDNSVDEALADHTRRVDITLHADQSLEVIGDGRGVLVDIHPEEGVPVIKLILCRLHMDGKFFNENYQFSGGLHGVGISVANTLLKRIEINVRHDGQIYSIASENGGKVQSLQVVGTRDKYNTGTSVYFWPDETFFDSPRFPVSRLTHVLKAKAVLCPGVEIISGDEINDTRQYWCYQDDLNDYLAETVNGLPTLPEKPSIGNFAGDTETADWALLWLPEGGELLTESYVNLIPTMQGDTHIDDLRQSLLDAVREFYGYRNILPHDVKLLAEDIWDRCAYVLSVKIQNPQFARQTKERPSSRQCAAFASGVVKDAFILWLNQNVQAAELPAEIVISSAQHRMHAAKKVARKKLISGPALSGRLADYTAQDLNRTEPFLVEGDFAGGFVKQTRDREYQATMPLKGRILNTWEVSSDEVLVSQEVHDILVAVGIDPDSDDLSQLCYGRVCILADADSDSLHIVTLLCALFVKHFHALVKHSHVYVALPSLYHIDLGKEVYYALTEEEKEGVLEQLGRKKGKSNIQCFKDLGEMSSMQLRGTTLDPNARRLVQLTIDDEDDQRTDVMMGTLLAKKRSEGRHNWLQEKGDMAEIEV